MKNLIFLLVSFISITLSAQKTEEKVDTRKWSVGLTLAPQITCANFKNWEQIDPLHATLNYQATADLSIRLGYTVKFSNLLLVVGYKDWYCAQTLFTDKLGEVYPDNVRHAYIGIGYLKSFDIWGSQAFGFLELGTNYEVTINPKQQPLQAIFSFGALIPFEMKLGRK